MKQLNTDHLDYLVVKVLRKLGNRNPHAKQIILLKSLLTTTTTTQSLSLQNNLTSREVACLLLVAKGQTSAQSADTLGLKVTSIETYRNRIKRKLQSSNLAQAVYEGIRLGYLIQKNP